MVKPRLPSCVRGHPQAAAVFVGCAAWSALIGLYGTMALLRGSNRFPIEGVLFDLGVATVLAAIAIAIARGRPARGRALELSASVGLCILFWATLAEMLGEPARADRLTAHCYLIMVGAGVAIQSRGVLVILTAAAVPSWAAVAFVIHAPGFHPNQWWSTWAITVAAAFAAQLITRTERGVGQRTRRAAQNSSLQDPLTGLANRRGLEQQVASIFALAQQSGQSVWCAFIDVDRFKTLNDRLGHEAGDEVLVAVASALHRAARVSDVSARWGGDEFVLLGLGKAPEARDLEERFAAQFRQLPSRITDVWTPGLTVGSATVTGRVENVAAAFNELLDEADKRLYERRLRAGATRTKA